MNVIVSVPLMQPPTPCANLPNSFAADFCQVSHVAGSAMSCQYSISFPVVGCAMAFAKKIQLMFDSVHCVSTEQLVLLLVLCLVVRAPLQVLAPLEILASVPRQKVLAVRIVGVCAMLWWLVPRAHACYLVFSVGTMLC
jgi:hypothetical protein